MRIFTLAIIFSMSTFAIPTVASAQNCNYSYQSAKDGSACGDRAANRRSGGR